MQKVMRLVAVVCCGIAFLQIGTARSEERVALVIGNSVYQHTRALPNPKNDAGAIAKLLQEKSFSVTLKLDLDYRAMRRAVRAFGQKAREADVALVYYGGHGLEVAGQNYLMPTDAKLEREADLEYEVVTLASVLDAVASARRLRLVILDACRNNPLGERMHLASGIKRSVNRGLARIEPHRNVLVAYAAKEGTVAQDGSGQHSPYAEALLKHMSLPGLDVRLMFGKVRDHVLAATRFEQEPYTYGSLSGDVIPLVAGAPSSAQNVELVFWNSVKDSKSPAILETYLDRYPSGAFAPLARAMLQQLKQLKQGPLDCGPGKLNVDGRCVAKTAPNPPRKSKQADTSPQREEPNRKKSDGFCWADAGPVAPDTLVPCGDSRAQRRDVPPKSKQADTSPQRVEPNRKKSNGFCWADAGPVAPDTLVPCGDSRARRRAF